MSDTTHPGEAHADSSDSRLNALRAAVLGANDGIVSVAGIVLGVAGATSARGPIFTAGLAGLVAGAVSMALGEYVSVSSQRDSERAMLDRERQELAETPEDELAELAAIYESKGLSAATARQVARRADRARRARRASGRRAEPRSRRPGQPDAGGRGVGGVVHPRARSCRCWPSCCRRPAGGCRSPSSPCCVALGIAGATSARAGGSDATRAVLRVVIGGAIGLAFTFGVGHLFGTAVG